MKVWGAFYKPDFNEQLWQSRLFTTKEKAIEAIRSFLAQDFDNVDSMIEYYDFKFKEMEVE